MLLVTTIIVIVLSLVITIYLWILKSSYNYFKVRGIPGPPPHFFFGHFFSVWSDPIISRQLQKWTHQFGSIYGLFEGTRPTYVVSNVEFLEEVFVKQFSFFHSRHLAFIVRLPTGNRIHLFAAVGKRWRRQRHIINPTFSSAKLKLMSSLVDRCIQALMDAVKQQEQEQQFNIYLLYKRLTMDVICHCAFGIDTDMQNDIDNPFLHKSAEFFAEHEDKLFMVQLSFLMPWLIPLLVQIVRVRMALYTILRSWAPRFMEKSEELPGSWIMNKAQGVVNARIAANESDNDGRQRRIDLLQLMIDAASQDEVKDTTDDDLTSKKLHYDEVTANVLLFMAAGYETTSTALAYCTYILATKPDIQRKLQTEIDEMNSAFDYDSVNNMVYMDLFIREVLRMYPIAIQAVSRECDKETTVCGYNIQKGDVIQPDVYSLHYDSELWGPEDPNLFIPERHSTPRHPMSFMSFGAGPRKCVGMRFALTEIKFCLCHLLHHYSILPGDNIEQGFLLRETLVIQPDAIYIKINKRS